MVSWNGHPNGLSTGGGVPRVARLTIAAASVTLALVTSGCDWAGERADAAAHAKPAVQRSWSVGRAAGTSNPQVGITITLDRDRITTADRLHAVIRITTAAGTTAEWAPPETELGGFTIAAHARAERTQSDGASIVEHDLMLEPFLDGEKAIPPITVRYDAPGQPAMTLTTEPIQVRVDSVLATDDASAELAPPKPLQALNPARRDRSWVTLVMAALLVGAYPAAFIAARIHARRRGVGNRRSEDPVASVLSEVSEIEGLLRDSRASAAAPPSECSTRLAVAYREYLSHLLATDVRGRLAGDIAPQLVEAGLEHDAAERTLSTLNTLDQVRFSGTPLPFGALQQMNEGLAQLVAATRGTLSAGARA